MDKVSIANNKLELQLREAKINVIKDRIASKEEKLANIKQTIQKLEGHSNKKKEQPTKDTPEIVKNEEAPIAPEQETELPKEDHESQ
jgi:hypothetical protein